MNTLWLYVMFFLGFFTWPASSMIARWILNVIGRAPR